MLRSSLIIVATLALRISGESYIPQYIEGSPQNGKVVSTAPPDLRKNLLYRIEHEVLMILDTDFQNICDEKQIVGT